jgi:hypothetical protein
MTNQMVDAPNSVSHMLEGGVTGDVVPDTFLQAASYARIPAFVVGAERGAPSTSASALIYASIPRATASSTVQVCRLRIKRDQKAPEVASGGVNSAGTMAAGTSSATADVIPIDSETLLVPVELVHFDEITGDTTITLVRTAEEALCQASELLGPYRIADSTVLFVCGFSGAQQVRLVTVSVTASGRLQMAPFAGCDDCARLEARLRRCMLGGELRNCGGFVTPNGAELILHGGCNATGLAFSSSLFRANLRTGRVDRLGNQSEVVPEPFVAHHTLFPFHTEQSAVTFVAVGGRSPDETAADDVFTDDPTLCAVTTSRVCIEPSDELLAYEASHGWRYLKCAGDVPEPSVVVNSAPTHSVTCGPWLVIFPVNSSATVIALNPAKHVWVRLKRPLSSAARVHTCIRPFAMPGVVSYVDVNGVLTSWNTHGLTEALNFTASERVHRSHMQAQDTSGRASTSAASLTDTNESRMIARLHSVDPKMLRRRDAAMHSNHRSNSSASNRTPSRCATPAAVSSTPMIMEPQLPPVVARIYRPDRVERRDQWRAQQLANRELMQTATAYRRDPHQNVCGSVLLKGNRQTEPPADSSQYRAG